MKRVVLIGDSIRKGYQGVVREELAGTAEVRGSQINGGDSANVVAHLDEWAIARAPDVVHVNAGLHDIKREFGSAEYQVDMESYKRNVRAILTRLQEETDAKIIWALTTPVIHAWHHEKKEFDRFEDDVVARNEAARQIARELEVEVNDLYGAVMAVGKETVLRPDGVHHTDEGYAMLGRAVAAAIRPCLG